MSHTAHIPSHRKPRRGASKVAIRAGVAGGVLSTIAVAGAAGPANAAEPVTETIEMPTLTSGLAGAVAQSADATQRVALNLELGAQENAAATKAAQAARKARAEAERKAEAQKAEARKKAEATARAKADAAARASRTAERTTLSSASSNSDSGSSTATTPPKASTSAGGSAGALIAFAQAQLGDAYVMGSTGPNAWDCSGLVQAAYRQIGVDLPRVSQDQSTAGTQVSLSNLQPGDILYWGGAGSAYHTAIYIGGGEFIGAQNPSSGVVQKTLDWDPPSGAVRVL
ncbi:MULTISPECIES: C40 family peptidase [unclassified Streptomyces]|uniref:C40 family peptidase n=1 Tax=unclassified Streptomyces TaxID=2593676 RepID=UPI00341F79B5|nr:C40 family peptidase [Streptomyces sp. NBC_00872]